MIHIYIIRPFTMAFLFCWLLPLHAQNIIRGKVSDRKENPVSYASISIDGTYEGTFTDDSGHFEIKTNLTGTIKVIATSIGLEPGNIDVDLAAPVPYLSFALKESYSSLSPAVITAGTFAASDQGKAELFRPRDIGTTAGTPGDMQATIESLPGTQRVEYTEGLFVRGGSGRESRYIMDGLIFPDPYFSNVPSLKQHGRLDPFLFSGTTFSSGGYSAQYGQALSSVLILNSKGIADSTITGGGIHTFGGNVFHTHRWDKASLNANINYNDLSVYHSLSNTRTDWLKSPVIRELRMVFRYKPDKNSIFRMFADISDTKSGIRLRQPESVSPVDFRITNKNYIVNGNYTKYYKNERSSLYAGAAVSGNYNHIRYAGLPLEQSEKLAQLRFVFRNTFTNDLRLITGGEYMGTFLSGRSDTLHSTVDDHLIALFTEGEATVKGKLAVRAGIRSEFSHYAGNNLAPRLSIAYKFSKSSQVSVSYGTFHQLPDKMDMLFNPQGLASEKASHYLLNYQFRLNDRTLRAEFYYKKYECLVTDYHPQMIIKPEAGYARGFEIFYRDKASVDNLDWWLSYSLTGSKRRTIIEGELITPDYISAHSISVVAKYWFALPGILASTSFSYSSPRKFHYRDEHAVNKSLGIPARYGIDISLSKPALIFNRKAMIFLSWQNLTGFDKLLGYIRIPTVNEPFSVYRTEKRSLFIGLFISMYND